MGAWPQLHPSPSWDKPRAGFRPFHPSLLLAAQESLPRTVAWCQLSPSQLCPSLPLCSHAPGQLLAGLPPCWWQQGCQRAEPGKEAQTLRNRDRSSRSGSPAARLLADGVPAPFWEIIACPSAQRQLRCYHVTSELFLCYGRIRTSKPESCSAWVWRQEPEGLVGSGCTQSPRSAMCHRGTGADECLCPAWG